ncbi:probable serine/threonine-protein kinase PBL19 [Tanacetum coccineum]|uniref:Probable serine/threonine-protein kinase PBL19 n=1 Tax=Tanacetum coccineum TaxID=301880 RepID=A0ABQ5CVT1_9ASTR
MQKIKDEWDAKAIALKKKKTRLLLENSEQERDIVVKSNQVIFPDFQSSNVLLDNFSAKLSDFGFAREGPQLMTGQYPQWVVSCHLVILGSIIDGAQLLDGTRFHLLFLSQETLECSLLFLSLC